MPVPAPRAHAPVVEVVDRLRVHAGRQRQGFPHNPVLELGDQLGLPAEPLHLPGPQHEGGHGDQGEDYEAGAVLAAAGAHELGRVVEDRGEGWVFGGGADGARGGVGEGAAEDGVGLGAGGWRGSEGVVATVVAAAWCLRGVAVGRGGRAKLGLEGLLDSSGERLRC